MSALTSKKIYSGIDLFKLIASLLIVLLHATETQDWIACEVRYVLTRFAVPFFFMVSGFFFYKGLNRAENKKVYFWKYEKNLAKLYLIWALLIYAPFELAVYFTPNTDTGVIQFALVILRRFFHMPIFGATEIAKYGIMVAASLSLMTNEWYDGNIEMTLITDKLGNRSRTLLRVIMNSLACVGFIYVSYYMILQAIYKFNTGEASQDLHIPIFIFVIILAFGGMLLAFCNLYKAIMYGYAYFKKQDLGNIHEGKIEAAPPSSGKIDHSIGEGDDTE